MSLELAIQGKYVTKPTTLPAYSGEYIAPGSSCDTIRPAARSMSQVWVLSARRTPLATEGLIIYLGTKSN